MAPAEVLLFWSSIALYSVASGGVAYALVFRNERFLRPMIGVSAVGLAVHTGAIVARYSAQGHLPWSGDYENALAVGWVIVCFTVVGAARSRALQVLAAGTLPLVVLLMGFGVMRNPRLGPLAASLKSSWLVVHVFFAWLAFGAYALAMAGGVAHELKRREAARESPNPVFARLPGLERLDELVFRWVVFGFIADAVMIASGAIWARDLWGGYWAWDPVETWSLVTWLTYGIAIHLRVTRGWRGARFARVAVFAIVASLITMFGVTFVVETSNHFFNVR